MMMRCERGAALLVVTIVMLVVLVGGLAAVAITSGELASSRGFRTRQLSETCARAGIEEIRSIVDAPGLTNANAVSGSITIGGATLNYQAGHYSKAVDNTLDSAVRVLEEGTYDATALMQGENITNSLGAGGGGADGGLYMLSATSRCSGSGVGEREMQIIFQYGTGLGAR